MQLLPERIFMLVSGAESSKRITEGIPYTYQASFAFMRAFNYAPPK